MPTELQRTTCVAWRKWLATAAGMEGMLWLREQVPAIQKGPSESIIYDAGKSQGFKDCLDLLPDVMGKVEPKQESLENP